MDVAGVGGCWVSGRGVRWTVVPFVQRLGSGRREADTVIFVRVVESKVPGDSTRMRFPWGSGRVWSCVQVEGQ